MNKIGYLIGFFILLSCLAGCKKTKLDGELELLAGNWLWVESYGTCSHQWPWCTYTSIDEGFTIEYQFDEKGKYKLLKNEVVIEKGRLIIDTYDTQDSFNEGGIIRINFRTINKSKENKTERVFLDGDNNMYFNEYPMQDLDGWNYYIRN